jgi:hypothetical protein
MREFSLAFLSVGLCFYNAYLWKIRKKYDSLAGFIALFAALAVFIVH